MYVCISVYIYNSNNRIVAVEHQQPITEVYLYSRRRGTIELPGALQSIIHEKCIFVNEDRCLDKIAIFIRNMCQRLMRSPGQSGAEEPALGCDGGWEKWLGCWCHPPALFQKKPPENTYPHFTFKSSGCCFPAWQVPWHVSLPFLPPARSGDMMSVCPAPVHPATAGAPCSHTQPQPGRKSCHAVASRSSPAKGSRWKK